MFLEYDRKMKKKITFSKSVVRFDNNEITGSYGYPYFVARNMFFDDKVMQKSNAKLLSRPARITINHGGLIVGKTTLAFFDNQTKTYDIKGTIDSKYLQTVKQKIKEGWVFSLATDDNTQFIEQKGEFNGIPYSKKVIDMTIIEMALVPNPQIDSQKLTINFSRGKTMALTPAEIKAIAQQTARMLGGNKIKFADIETDPLTLEPSENGGYDIPDETTSQKVFVVFKGERISIYDLAQKASGVDTTTNDGEVDMNDGENPPPAKAEQKIVSFSAFKNEPPKDEKKEKENQANQKPYSTIAHLG